MNQEIITNRLKIIQDMADELKKIKNSIQDALDNNEDYLAMQEATNQHKVAVRQKRDRIAEDPIIKDLELQLREKRKELKEIKEVLSQELADYYREEGTMQIEDHNGDIKKLKFNVSLIS